MAWHAICECTMDATPCRRENTLPQRTSCTVSRIMDISATRQLANILDSSPSAVFANGHCNNRQ